jgi:phosphonate transport system substrate-binding protein
VAPGSAPSPDRTDSDLIFAVASSSPEARGHLGALCEELGRALSRRVAPSVVESYAALSEEVAAGRAHVVWAAPLVAVEMERAGLVSIAMCCKRGGLVGYHWALFTRHGSPVGEPAELRGKHVAWVDAQSSAGYAAPRVWLAAAGLDPRTLFGKESFLGSHARVAIAVLDGEADAGATYLSLDETGRPISAGWLEAGAGVNGAYILAQGGPIPADSIVLSNRLSADEKQVLTTALAALPRALPDAALGLLRAEALEVPPPGHFDELRKISSAMGPGAA